VVALGLGPVFGLITEFVVGRGRARRGAGYRGAGQPRDGDLLSLDPQTGDAVILICG
jgi:hypothetical protein